MTDSREQHKTLFFCHRTQFGKSVQKCFETLKTVVMKQRMERPEFWPERGFFGHSLPLYLLTVTSVPRLFYSKKEKKYNCAFSPMKLQFT